MNNNCSVCRYLKTDEYHDDHIKYMNGNGQENHNCYDYAINLYDPKQQKTTQPGYNSIGKVKRPPYKCDDIEKRVLLDNKGSYKLGVSSAPIKTCLPGYRKISLFIDDGGGDFHFLRREPNGLWTHKVGNNPVSAIDSNNLTIEDPSVAQLRNYPFVYSEMCGKYCIKKI